MILFNTSRKHRSSRYNELATTLDFARAANLSVASIQSESEVAAALDDIFYENKVRFYQVVF